VQSPWYGADFDNIEPLVTTYVAMQGAVSAGAWGDNDIDTRVTVGTFPRERAVPDLYRFFEHGRDGINTPGLGTNRL